MLANAPAEVKAIAPKGVGVMTAGAPPAAVTIQRIEDELGWAIIQIYGLTETAPAISICEPRPEHQSLSSDERARIKARQGVELITSGELRVVDDQGREVPADGDDAGRDHRARQRRHGRATTTIPRPPRSAWATAGSIPAMPPSCIPTATCRSPIG